jgi:hypothetical protein
VGAVSVHGFGGLWVSECADAGEEGKWGRGGREGVRAWHRQSLDEFSGARVGEEEKGADYFITP